MCGLAGELRFDGRAADVAALRADDRGLAHRGPDGDGLWARGPVALGHRRLAIIDLCAAGAQPMVDAELGLTVVFNGCIYNYQAAARRAARATGYRFFSTSDTEVIVKAYAQWGTDCVDHFLGMFAFAIVEHATGPAGAGPRPARHQAALPRPRRPGGCGSPRRCRRCSPPAASTPRSTGRAAPLHDASTRSCRRRARSSTASASCRRRPCGWSSPTARRPTHVYWAPAVHPRPRHGRLERAATGRRRCSSRCGPPSSGGWSPTCRSACCCPAASTPASSSRCSPRRGRATWQTFSIGFEAGGGESGDEFEYSDLVAEALRHRPPPIRIDDARLLPGVDAAVAAMSEPMVSHDCVAFYLLSEEVVAAASRSCSRARAPTRCSAATTGTRRWPASPASDAVEAYADVFFDRRWTAMAGSSDAGVAGRPTTRRREFVAASFGRPGRRDRGRRRAAQRHADHAGRRPGEAGRQHDDGVGPRGAGAVPRPRVRRAGRPHPAGAEARRRRQGRAEARRPAASCRTRSSTGPRATSRCRRSASSTGPMLERVRDALTDPAARGRGLFRADAVEALLADPNAPGRSSARTRCGSSALLEMWLQDHGVG